jgi:hypothetical protein
VRVAVSMKNFIAVIKLNEDPCAIRPSRPANTAWAPVVRLPAGNTCP